jgi:hypothetical protein
MAVSKVASSAILKESRKNAGPARHADRGSVVVIVEDHSVGSQLINVGSFRILIPVTTERVCALIVSEKENQIGSLRFGQSPQQNEKECEKSRSIHGGTVVTSNYQSGNCLFGRIALPLFPK